MSEHEKTIDGVLNPGYYCDHYGNLVNSLGFCQLIDSETSLEEKQSYCQSMMENLNQIIMSAEQDEALIPEDKEALKEEFGSLLNEARSLKEKVERLEVDSTSANDLIDIYYRTVALIK